MLDRLEPISTQDVRALINTCQRGDFFGERDRALFLFLFDTGARAWEACKLNIKDIGLNIGSVMIRYGKGLDYFRLPRIVDLWTPQKK